MQRSFWPTEPQTKNGKIAKPFLKWAGGKGQLIDALAAFFPPELKTGEITKYAEPFIGGGAVFFYVAQTYPAIQECFISDVNQELVLAYTAIQRDVESLIRILRTLEKEYHALDRDKQKDYFYAQRDAFNANLEALDFNAFGADWVERTATIIFLNRTCFNGLFRVNAKGKFNVPFGDYKNPTLCDADNLRTVSAVLQNARIEHGDFRVSEPFCDAHTFVYFDPPYRPLSVTASFTSYSKYQFDDDAQRRLAAYFNDLSTKKCKLMLSNSDPRNANPNDQFFHELYQGHVIQTVDATRIINSDSTKRGKISELVIMNYS